jgi:hypothetical protein
MYTCYSRIRILASQVAVGQNQTRRDGNLMPEIAGQLQQADARVLLGLGRHPFSRAVGTAIVDKRISSA